jgi:lipid A 3-O-deacylase
VVMQYEYGILFAKKKIGIAFYEKLTTPEFKGYFSQQIGNVTFYIRL